MHLDEQVDIDYAYESLWWVRIQSLPRFVSEIPVTAINAPYVPIRFLANYHGSQLSVVATQESPTTAFIHLVDRLNRQQKIYRFNPDAAVVFRALQYAAKQLEARASCLEVADNVGYRFSLVPYVYTF